MSTNIDQAFATRHSAQQSLLGLLRRWVHEAWAATKKVIEGDDDDEAYVVSQLLASEP